MGEVGDNLMDQGNRLCGECSTNPASFFCTCSQPEAFLCDSCFLKHNRKFSRKGHKSWPIAELAHYNNPRFLDRKEAFLRVKEEALRCEGEVERAIQMLKSKVLEIQAALSALCDEHVHSLRQLQQQLAKEVPEALEEVETTLIEDRPRITSQIGALLRACVDTPGPLNLFTFSLETCTPQALFSVRFHLRSPSTPQLNSVYRKEAIVYDVDSERLTKRTLSVDFGKGVSCVELDRERLLCIGAMPASSAVYVLDMTTFELSAWPSLCSPRRAAGVAKVSDRVYVFGGSSETGNLRSSEKLELSNKRWNAMGDMQYARGGFTPCLHQQLLYLVSNWPISERTIEVFSPETEAFSVLPVSLPPQLQLKGSSVAFLVNGELCLLTGNKQMGRWKIDTESDFRVSDTGEAIWSNQQPLIVGSVALIAYAGGVYHISLVSYMPIKYVA